MRVPFTALCFSLLAPAVAFAQDPPPPPPPPAVVEPAPAPAPVAPTPPAVAAVVEAAPVAAPAAPAAPTWKDSLTIEGLVDSYYMLSLTHPDGGGIGSSPTSVRNFDVSSNSFTLAYAKLGIGMSAGPAAFRLDLGYGQVGSIINGSSALLSGGAMAPGVASLYGSAFIAQQAYASLTPVTNLTIDFGKFVTNAGSEVIEANKNWLYSRSLLFFTIPLVHTGLRVGYKVNALLLQASLVNGINNDPDTATVKQLGKTVGLTANYTDGPVTAIVNYYGGYELPSTPWKSTLDIVGGFTVNDKVALNLNVDYIKVGDANTFGVAVMGKFGLTDMLYLAARGEFLKDKNLTFVTTAATPGPFDGSVYEGTAMLGIMIGKNLEVRPEVRADFSDKDTLFNGKKNQVTGTLAVLAFI